MTDRDGESHTDTMCLESEKIDGLTVVTRTRWVDGKHVDQGKTKFGDGSDPIEAYARQYEKDGYERNELAPGRPAPE